jgi:hypothetical protein
VEAGLGARAGDLRRDVVLVWPGFYESRVSRQWRGVLLSMRNSRALEPELVLECKLLEFCVRESVILSGASWQVIGTPTLVGGGCLLAQSLLSSSQISSCVEMTQRAYNVLHDGTKHSYLSGANIFDITKVR